MSTAPTQLLAQIDCILVGLHTGIFQDGFAITGELHLDAPNPSRRVRCKVSYIRPRAWTDAEQEAALRVAAHWFRDIGGFQTIAKRHLCHIVARLKEGMTEREIHFAIKAYAESEWHRKNGARVVIARFFVRDHVEQWADKSEDLRRERDDDWQKKQAVVHEAQEAQRLEADRKRVRAEREQAKQKPVKRPPNTVQTPLKPGAKSVAKAAEIKTFWDANDRLPKSMRWVLPVLISDRSKPPARDRAKGKLEETVKAIWPILPKSVRSQVRSHVQMAAYRRTGSFDAPTDRPTDDHARAILKIARDTRSRVAPIARSVNRLEAAQ